MTKKKNKTKTKTIIVRTTKKKKSRKSKANVPYGMSRRPAYEATAVCSNLDPFCSHAYGAKLMDKNSAKSLTFQVRDLRGMVSDAAGGLAYMFSCSPQYKYSEATIVANAVTAWGAWATNSFNTSIGATCGKWRVVSWGVHISSYMPINTSSGLICTTEVSENVTGTTGQNLVGTTFGTDYMMYPAAGQDLWFVGKPIDDNPGYTSGVSTANFNSHTSLIVTATGLPAGIGCFMAEQVINYEWIPASTANGYNVMASPAADNSDTVMSARSKAAGQLPVSFSAKSNVEVGHQIMDTAESVLGMANRAVGIASQLVPYGRVAGMAMRSLSGPARRLLTNVG